MTYAIGTDANPRDGDQVTFTIELAGGRVRVVQTLVKGCEGATRSTREVARLAQGRTPAAAMLIRVGEIIEKLGIDPDGERCALTAVAALRAALVDLHVRQLA